MYRPKLVLDVKAVILTTKSQPDTPLPVLFGMDSHRGTASAFDANDEKFRLEPTYELVINLLMTFPTQDLSDSGCSSPLGWSS